MSYTQIFNTLYEDDADATTLFADADADAATLRAWSALKVLLERNGFDSWWADIDDDDKDEIFDELRVVVA